MVAMDAVSEKYRERASRYRYVRSVVVDNMPRKVHLASDCYAPLPNYIRRDGSDARTVCGKNPRGIWIDLPDYEPCKNSMCALCWSWGGFHWFTDCLPWGHCTKERHQP